MAGSLAGQHQIQQVLKQINRIKRYSCQLSKKSASNINETDEILGSCLKIQKILNKAGSSKSGPYPSPSPSPILHQHPPTIKQIQQDDSRSQYDKIYQGEDFMYRQAVESMGRMMQKMGKFQRRMGLMIHEAEFKKHYRDAEPDHHDRRQLRKQQPVRHNVDNPNNKKTTKNKQTHKPNPNKTKTKQSLLQSHQLQNLDKQIQLLMQQIKYEQNQAISDQAQGQVYGTWEGQGLGSERYYEAEQEQM